MTTRKSVKKRTGVAVGARGAKAGKKTGGTATKRAAAAGRTRKGTGARAVKKKVKTTSSLKGNKMGRITFEIDGKECRGKAGQTIVEAARDNGIYIPVLCWYKGQNPTGACRICTVKVGGRNMAACTTPIAQGMIVENEVPELEDMRKALVEMLFVEGNHMCPTCEKSGNCELQAMGYRYQLLAPRFPYLFPKRNIDANYTKIMIDNNRCIQCRRCVRGITSKDGKNIFAMTGRSGESTVMADRELEANMSDEAAMKAMDMCPVGAILKKEVGFAVPIGRRRYDAAPIGSEISGNRKGGL